MFHGDFGDFAESLYESGNSFPLSYKLWRTLVGLCAMDSNKQISDESVVAIIRELFGEGRAVTGVSVRRELRQRFGKPGGVSRVYRLISATLPDLRRAALRPNSDSEARLLEEIAQLKKQIVSAHAAREFAEQQEIHWIKQLDELRQYITNADFASRTAEPSQIRSIGFVRRHGTMNSLSTGVNPDGYFEPDSDESGVYSHTPDPPEGG